MSRAVEVWSNRVFAESFDEAAMKIRQATGFEAGELFIRDIIPNVWYEYKATYTREGRGE